MTPETDMDEFVKDFHAARAAGFAYVCLYCGAGLDEERQGEHREGCTARSQTDDEWRYIEEAITEESLLCMKPSHRALEAETAALRRRVERAEKALREAEHDGELLCLTIEMMTTFSPNSGATESVARHRRARADRAAEEGMTA